MVFRKKHEHIALDISVRMGSQVEAIKQDFSDNLVCIQGKFPIVASDNDFYMALAYAIRDRLMSCWAKTAKTYFQKASRTVCYLSAEFLIGPQLGNNINNLMLYPAVKQAMQELGLDIEELLEQEVEPGLGNGGLGRLAACFMDSMATLGIPAIGYGIRYEFGIFNQEIRDGWQVESTDKWLRYGNPWEIPRPEITFDIKFGGRIEHYVDELGTGRVRWIPDKLIRSVAYDIPIIGYQSKTANFLRLWKAEACEAFDFQAFNAGNYYGAIQEKIASENITKVLYPNDEPLVGKELRLEQQYLFVSSSLQDMIRIYQQRNKSLDAFAKKYAIQLNDTHPALGIAELMRLLVDEYSMSWEKAWDITQQAFGYTNHTILPEALEKWPIALFARVLPRHLEIILEINRRFLDDVRLRISADAEFIQRVSLIDETGERYVRMANLACVGSHAINGVSKLHTEILKQQVFKDFHNMWPEKFSNKTNGITQRRFLLLINPKLARLVTEAIGDGWIKYLDQLRHLEPLARDTLFRSRWQQIRSDNKKSLAAAVYRLTGVTVDPQSMFDVQTKRIHLYKRQHLNLLHVITLYNRLRNDPNSNAVPRTVIFAGKAAPGYFLAKLMIKLINSVANVINNDKSLQGRLKVVFIPNFNVKNSHWIFPAADLSEQISTAGTEASGTGNMKFALNGALTIGTLDGANIEIREAVGAENFFLFGLSADDILTLKSQGYKPIDLINANTELKMAIDLISSGHFSSGDTKLFQPLVDTILYGDDYMLCADYKSYMNCQSQVSTQFLDQTKWTQMSILNTARMGGFSSDRAIMEYCNNIWQVQRVEIP